MVAARNTHGGDRVQVGDYPTAFRRDASPRYADDGPGRFGAIAGPAPTAS